MSCEDLIQGRYYIFQPLPVKVQFRNCKPMVAQTAETVRYLGDNDEGWHVFERRNRECIALRTCTNVFPSIQPS